MAKIFASAMAYDQGKSGISDYMNNVLNQLAKNNEVDLAILHSDSKLFPKMSENLTFKIYPDYLKNPLVNMLWHTYILPFSVDWSKYDWIFLPAANRRLMCRYPKYTIGTFHDLSQFHITGKYDPLRMFFIRYLIPFHLKSISRICSISESTRRDLLEFYHSDASRIFVNPNGYDVEKLNSKDSLSPEMIKDKYGVKAEYLLYIARLEHPGKNHLNLIKAYELLPETLKDRYHLVLAGSDWSGAEQIHQYTESSSDYNRIHFTGFVDNKELSGLYRGATLYVFPSLFEGFGVPLLEAMACGVPVICSNRGSLPEVGGNAVVTFDPENPTEIAQVIKKVINDKSCMVMMRQNGYNQVSKFSWEKHSNSLVREYEQGKI